MVGGDPGGRVVDNVPVPRTVQEAVQRHVDQLDDVARGVLEVAAVIGQRFDFGLLQELAGCGEDELLRHPKRSIAARLNVERVADGLPDCLHAIVGADGSQLRELVAAAGFTRFRRATDTPFNRIFEARR